MPICHSFIEISITRENWSCFPTEGPDGCYYRVTSIASLIGEELLAAVMAVEKRSWFITAARSLAIMHWGSGRRIGCPVPQCGGIHRTCDLYCMSPRQEYRVPCFSVWGYSSHVWSTACHCGRSMGCSVPQCGGIHRTCGLLAAYHSC